MKEMKRLAMRVWLLAVLLAITACSKDDEDDILEQIPPSTETLSVDILSEKMKGFYFGFWQMNNEEVVADSLVVLGNEKYHQEENPVFTVPSLDYSNINNPHFFNFNVFPFKAIVKKMFPSIDIAYLTATHSLVSPRDQEERLLFDLIKEAEDAGIYNTLEIIKMEFLPIGFSDNMIYYELKSAEGSVFQQIRYVVTQKDGNYFAMVLDVVPTKSTICMDLSTKTIICKIHVKQIEIVDKDRQKSIKTLNPEIELTFTSTKRYEGIFF